MIDLDRLTAAERALYRRMFPKGIRPAVRARGARASSLTALWVFAVFSYRIVGTLPAVAVETLDARGYRPKLEPRLWEVAAPIRRARWERQRRVWTLKLRVYIRRAELRADRERIIALLRAEGERAAAQRRARRRRLLVAVAVAGLVVAAAVVLVVAGRAW